MFTDLILLFILILLDKCSGESSTFSIKAFIDDCTEQFNGCGKCDVPSRVGMDFDNFAYTEPNNDQSPVGPGVVYICERRIYISITMIQMGQITDEPEYIAVEEVIDPATGNSTRLLHPLLLKIVRHPLQVIYPLYMKHVVNGEIHEHVFNKHGHCRHGHHGHHHHNEYDEHDEHDEHHDGHPDGTHEREDHEHEAHEQHHQPHHYDHHEENDGHDLDHNHHAQNHHKVDNEHEQDHNEHHHHDHDDDDDHDDDHDHDHNDDHDDDDDDHEGSDNDGSHHHGHDSDHEGSDNDGSHHHGHDSDHEGSDNDGSHHHGHDSDHEGSDDDGSHHHGHDSDHEVSDDDGSHHHEHDHESDHEDSDVHNSLTDDHDSDHEHETDVHHDDSDEHHGNTYEHHGESDEHHDDSEEHHISKDEHDSDHEHEIDKHHDTDHGHDHDEIGHHGDHSHILVENVHHGNSEHDGDEHYDDHDHGHRGNAHHEDYPQGHDEHEHNEDHDHGHVGNEHHEDHDHDPDHIEDLEKIMHHASQQVGDRKRNVQSHKRETDVRYEPFIPNPYGHDDDGDANDIRHFLENENSDERTNAHREVIYNPALDHGHEDDNDHYGHEFDHNIHKRDDHDDHDAEHDDDHDDHDAEHDDDHDDHDAEHDEDHDDHDAEHDDDHDDHSDQSIPEDIHDTATNLQYNQPVEVIPNHALDHGHDPYFDHYGHNFDHHIHRKAATDESSCSKMFYDGKPLPYTEGFCCSCNPDDDASIRERSTHTILRDPNLLSTNPQKREGSARKIKRSLKVTNLDDKTRLEMVENRIKRESASKSENEGSSVLKRRRRKCDDIVTQHCLHLSHLWYTVFRMDKPFILQEIGLQIYMKQTEKWVDLTRGSFFKLGTFFHEARDSLPTIIATYSNTPQIVDEKSMPIVYENHVLLIPSHIQEPGHHHDFPEIHGGPEEYLVVPDSELSSDGRACDKIGTFFEGFVSDINRCEKKLGDCLHHQPVHLWTHDMRKHLHGKKGKYFVRNYGDIPNPIISSHLLKGDYLALLYHGRYESTIEVEVRADINTVVRHGGTGVIQSIYMDNTAHSIHTTIEILIMNAGLAPGHFRVVLSSCIMNFPKVNPRGNLELLAPQQSHLHRMRIEEFLPESPIYCSVLLVNEHDKVVASRALKIHRKHRCLCAYHCECECIGNNKPFSCSVLPRMEYESTGFRWPPAQVPHSHGAPWLRLPTLHDAWIIFLLWITVLLLFGKLKGCIGLYRRDVWDYGLDFFRTEYPNDECNAMQTLLEVFLNAFFFILYPIKLLLTLIDYLFQSLWECLRCDYFTGCSWPSFMSSIPRGKPSNVWGESLCEDSEASYNYENEESEEELPSATSRSECD